MSIFINNGVKPKKGRLATGSYSKTNNIPIGIASPFPDTPVTTDGLPVGRGLSMPSDRTLTVYQHPNANQFDVSTGMLTRPKVQLANNSTVLTDSLPGTHNPSAITDIGPHEHGKFWKTKVVPVQKTQFGASGDKTSNTAFHPRMQEVIKDQPAIASLNTAENEFLPSFFSRNNLWSDPNNSFIQGRENVNGNGVGSGRWTTVKVGAGG